MNGYWNRCTALPISGSECRATRHSPYLHRLAGPAFIPLGGHPRTQHLSRLTTNPAFIPLGANPVFIPLGANPGFIPLGARQILNLVRKESLPPLAGEGGRRPEGGNTKPAFIQLSGCLQTQRLPRLAAAHEPRVCPAWRAQNPEPCTERIPSPAFGGRWPKAGRGEYKTSIYPAWRLSER